MATCLFFDAQFLLQDCEAKFIEKRTENCVQDDSGRKRKFEKCDLDSYRSEEAFTNIYRKGKAETVHDFLTNKGFDVAAIGNDAKQLKFVQEDTGLPTRIKIPYQYLH